jgi:chorismate mutase / prephenate dehydratase
MSTFSLILPGWDLTSTAMPPTPPDLTALRRRLDEIDDRLQDLLIERAEIVAMVAASKRDGNQPPFQPAREAEIIRRLVARHHGAFPVATLVRMWREMLAATVRLQSPFSVAVFAPTGCQGYWDLARDHYGSQTPMAACGEVGEVITAVVEARASVGVLPVPETREADPWWPHLLAIDEGPQVIARLPFGARGNARTNGAEALAIGGGIPQKTGFDRTLLAIECATEITRARVLKLLSARGLACTFFASCPRGVLGLIEVEEFVPITDSRIENVRGEMGAGLRRLVPFGAYAVPLPLLALDSTG